MTSDNEIQSLLNEDFCHLCPRECYTARNSSKLGYCETDDNLSISSICIHNGEEPPVSGLKGICNVFFAHCNLQCIYCQNEQISNNYQSGIVNYTGLNLTVQKIIEILNYGIDSVGFVSPSHQVPQLVKIIENIKQKGYNPAFVYNTNSYDKPVMIEYLSRYIKVFLPDFKYSDNNLAKRFSDADNYFETALASINEMYKQTGSDLIMNNNGYATKGLIIRHLVLPGEIENSKNVLKTIATEISNKVHLSLMSQYYPVKKIDDAPYLNRILYKEEYNEIVAYMNNLGFKNGWIQELESSSAYIPDFNKDKPFG